MKWYKFNINNLSENEYNKWFSLMDEEKQNRVNKFRFIDDKKRTVTGEMLAKKAISEHCNIDTENIVFSKNEYGKPFVKDLNIEFNISHSGDFVVCAIDDSPIGIDIEKVRVVSLKTIKKILTENELEYVFTHKPTINDYTETPTTDVLTRIFEVWTKKEAFTKQQGKSIFKFNKECKDNYITLRINDDDNNTYIVTIAYS